MKTKHVSQRDREAWLEHRNTYALGSSDLGAVLGFSSAEGGYQTARQLTRYKSRDPETRGRVYQNNPAINYGRRMEPIALQCVKKICKRSEDLDKIFPYTKWKIMTGWEEAYTLPVWPGSPYLCATADAILYLDNIKWTVEVKCKYNGKIDDRPKFAHIVQCWAQQIANNAAGSIYLQMAEGDDGLRCSAWAIHPERAIWDRMVKEDIIEIAQHCLSGTIYREGERRVRPPHKRNWTRFMNRAVQISRIYEKIGDYSQEELFQAGPRTGLSILQDNSSNK